jgi:hypothetical protein
MIILTVRVKHALDVAIERSHDADAREPTESATASGKSQTKTVCIGY